MIEPASRTSVVALSLLLAGCAGSTNGDDSTANEGAAGSFSAGGSDPSSACTDPVEAIDPTALIDDMEDQNSQVLSHGARTGGWWAAGDETIGATLVPAPGEPAFPEPIPGGRCGSQYAMRVTGQGFADWGAMLGLNLAYDSSGGAFYDASDYEGVTFWARVGDTSTNRIRFSVSDANSEPRGGKCSEAGDAGESCFDTFGVSVNSLDTTWRRYEVPFSGLAQRGFGLPAEALDTSTLYTIGFNVEANSVFDVWIDDVSFY